MTAEEIRAAENLVNEMILQNETVVTDLMTPDAAVKQGAMALFDEKYGETVRVVSMGQGDRRLSCELCGGTHVRATGDIGSFRILSEAAVSSGVRRIEAVIGRAALKQAQNEADLVENLTATLKVTEPDEILRRIQGLMADKKKLEKDVSDLRRQVAMGGTGPAGQDIEDLNGVKFIGKTLTDTPAKELKPLADELKKKVGSGVVALVAGMDGKVSVVVGVTDDLTGRINAVDLVRIASGVVGGQGGGGRPDMAQAGGNDISKMNEAVKTIKDKIGKLV